MRIKDNIYAVPVLHYTMEFALEVIAACNDVQPSCIAVELPQTMQKMLIHAAERLPDISVVAAYDKNNEPLYFLSEPCEGTFEALRYGKENSVDVYCIDLDVEKYPFYSERFPDAYALTRIGMEGYYKAYIDSRKGKEFYDIEQKDIRRELHMAKRLKELSLTYDKVLFVGGMAHIERILKYVDKTSFEEQEHATRDRISLCTLTEESCREVMAECGYYSKAYETYRESFFYSSKEKRELLEIPDRQKLLYRLLKESSIAYRNESGYEVSIHHLRNIMKFSRNWSLINNKLMPDLYQLLTAAKGCVDHNYAYEVWKLATEYPHLKNIDGLEQLDVSAEDIWGASKRIYFQLKHKKEKKGFLERLKKDSAKYRFQPPSPFGICSYQPEDVIIENFASFLKKKGVQLMMEEGAKVLPFTTSLEDGIDTKETIRHWHDGKLFVKTHGRPSGGVGSVVIIFDEDKNDEEIIKNEKFPWCSTWLGEHNQESDMAFYATHIGKKIVGPGISCCEYGGFMMSYPPRRMQDVWSDPDYSDMTSKSEVLLMAAIDYAVKPAVVYVAAKPARSKIKSYAKRFGKKIVYIPIGQLSSVTLSKLRRFHVLDGHDKRRIADEYIF